MARSKKSPVKKKKVIAKKAASKTKKRPIKKTISKPKKKKVSAIPKGYTSITPYLMLNEAANAIEFYKKVFGAKERLRMEYGNKIGHAELKIGNALIMLADECPEKSVFAASASQPGTGVSIHVYLKDVDAVFKKAVSLGAKVIRDIENMFYGDRSAGIQDPFGHTWFISTHIEDVTPAQTRKRAQALFGKTA